MSARLKEYENIEEELTNRLKQLLSGLPPNAASIKVENVPRTGKGVWVTLKPANPAATSIGAYAENGLDMIYFSFGDYGPTWELPIEGYSRNAGKEELLREVEDMSRAVIAGNCEYSRGLLSIRGRIQVDDCPYRVTDFFVFRALPPLRGTRKYEPYFESISTPSPENR